MKKVLAILLTAVLVMAASVCVVSAAPSSEAQGVISGITAKDADENEAKVTVEKIDGKVNKYFYNTLTGLKSETSNKTLKVVGHYNLKVEGSPKYPISIVLDVLGISDSSDVYVLLQNGKEVVSVTPTVKDGKVSFELEEKVEKIALVTDGKTAQNVEKENNVLSPQTADTSVFVIVAMFIAAVSVAFVSKKVKA